MERGWKSNVEISPPCPRCGSSNTKFCYYNNYSMTQPRYICKGCRRYWTKGGSLRNVPVGGGCRKSRRGHYKPFRDGSIGIPSRGGVAGGGTVVSLGHINGTMDNPILSAELSSMNGCTLAIKSQEEGSNNIDLALVYANFLNQKPAEPGTSHEADDHGAAAEPHDHHQLEVPILMPPNNIALGGSSSFHQLSSIQMVDLMTNQLSQGSGAAFVECRSLSDRSLDSHFSDGNAFYFSGLDSFEKQQAATDYHDQLMSTTTTATAMNQINNYVLPPLPGEELSTVNSQGIFWSGCSDDQMLFPGHKLHASQSSSGLEESQAVQDHPHDQLDENRCPFNVSIELCNINCAIFSGLEK